MLQTEVHLDDEDRGPFDHANKDSLGCASRVPLVGVWKKAALH